MMVVVLDRAGLSGWCGEWVHMPSVGEEGNAYRHLVLCLVQYGTSGKCPSFYYKDFFVTFLNCTFILMSIYNWTLQSIPHRAVTCNRPGTADAWITESEGVGFGVCQVGLKCVSRVATRRNLTDWDIMKLILELGCDTHSSKDEEFLLRVTETPTVT